ncbi:LAETG motif-containing sortase-dependent surface protein [Streptomyces sp. NPDC019990]|uniref:LAETG motif-containing sortase-dependent surface protein n=1 Tax=Streptomyces sp. NPDC019990 TaxID=3154693 RepID=UPI0033CF6A89
MKLRRAMAAAAATAVIAPMALLAAPAAYASDETSPAPSTSVSESATETTPPPSTSAPETTPPPSTSAPETTPPPSTSAPETTPPPSTSASPSSPAPSASEPEASKPPKPTPSACENSKVDVSINGLPGKISAGSGWHKFSLNVLNDSDSTLNDLHFYAGASADKYGQQMFASKKVQLQAWDPQDKTWVDLDAGGYAVGYVGTTDELEPDYQVVIPLRLNVKKSAPVGAGFSLGATIYGDGDAECTGYGEISYKFQIVSAGTDTDGTRPQEGGKAPVTDQKPSSDTPEVTGSLAETGSSSALPVIGLVGGAAVVAGAGAIFVVRRRKAGAEA